MAETRKRSFILSLKQLAYLEKEADRLGITVSDLLRRIIDQHREWPREGMTKLIESKDEILRRYWTNRRRTNSDTPIDKAAPLPESAVALAREFKVSSPTMRRFVLKKEK